MKVEKLIEILDSDFYAGVPDSQLRALNDYLHNYFGNDNHHIIAANEGNAVGLAAGYHLATGKVPVVYMQNSGEGNIINPLASLLNKQVYAIPVIFIIGWRGEPGVNDEPQHIYQGNITLKLLEAMGVEYMVISSETTDDEVEMQMEKYRSMLNNGDSVAFVVRKDALIYDQIVDYSGTEGLNRENVINHIVNVSGDDLIICTTGKASRELFEIRERRQQGHEHDFLTVGSMGHASSIALGIALNTDKKVWCIDGDGSMLMHMGAMAVIGNRKPENFVHIVLNNGAHETVGGMPTAVSTMDGLSIIAENLGYISYKKCMDYEKLDSILNDVKEKKGLFFIEIGCKIGSRADLGRPTIAPRENKTSFMTYIQQ